MLRQSEAWKNGDREQGMTPDAKRLAALAAVETLRELDPARLVSVLRSWGLDPREQGPPNHLIGQIGGEIRSILTTFLEPKWRVQERVFYAHEFTTKWALDRTELGYQQLDLPS